MKLEHIKWLFNSLFVPMAERTVQHLLTEAPAELKRQRRGDLCTQWCPRENTCRDKGATRPNNTSCRPGAGCAISLKVYLHVISHYSPWMLNIHFFSSQYSKFPSVRLEKRPQEALGGRSYFLNHYILSCKWISWIYQANLARSATL